MAGGHEEDSKLQAQTQSSTLNPKQGSLSLEPGPKAAPEANYVLGFLALALVWPRKTCNVPHIYSSA